MGASDAAVLLARALPDVPRWVETRSMLLGGECELFGLEGGGDPCFVVRGTGYPLVSVVGRPREAAIQEAVSWRRDREVIVPPENGEHVAAALPGWEIARAMLHLLRDEDRLPRVPSGTVRLIEPAEIDSIQDLPPDLRSELAAVRWSPIAASFEDGRPVAFCYADRTESLWDVAIDTLEGYRRRGHAARCVAYMVEYLRPVWGAENTNLASLGLAAKLGFVPVDELLLFRSDPAR